MSIRIKICGLSTEEAVSAARDAGADFLGFVFFPRSPRNVTAQHAAKLSALAPHIPAVAVTVDMTDEAFRDILQYFRPAYLQLHGHESPERVQKVKATFGIPIIKAISIESGDDIAKALAYENAADILLFDAKVPKGLPGGNGLAFDWQLLANRVFSRPWFLSGGLHTNNVEEALRVSGAKMLDVSSGLEIAPGIKSPTLIQSFIQKIRMI